MSANVLAAFLPKAWLVTSVVNHLDLDSTRQIRHFARAMYKQDLRIRKIGVENSYLKDQ